MQKKKYMMPFKQKKKKNSCPCIKIVNSKKEPIISNIKCTVFCIRNYLFTIFLREICKILLHLLA